MLMVRTCLLIVTIMLTSSPQNVARAQGVTAITDQKALEYSKIAGGLPKTEIEFGRALKKAYDAGFSDGQLTAPPYFAPGSPVLPPGGRTLHQPWSGGLSKMEIRDIDGKLVVIDAGKAGTSVISADQLNNLVAQGAISKKFDTETGKPFWSGIGTPDK